MSLRLELGQSCPGEVLSRVDERQFWIAATDSETVPQVEGMVLAEWVKDSPDQDEPEPVPAPGDKVTIWHYEKQGWYFFFVDARADVRSD